MNIGYATIDWAVTSLDLSGRPTIGGSGHARIAVPARALESRGHHVYIGSLVAERHTDVLGVKMWGGRTLGGFDVVVMQRWMNDDLVDIVKDARAKGQVVVNDVDDYFWGLDPRNQAHYGTDPRRDVTFNRGHYLQILRASSLVTVSTPFLADRLRERGVGRVKVLRNALQLRDWAVHDVDRSPPTVGWIGALPWRSGDLEELRPVMDRFLSAHEGLHFHHGGHVPGRDVAVALGLSEANTRLVTREPIASTLEYPSLWKPLDFTVIPLSAQPFNLAKSAIKGMEAAAAGVPFVASSTPEYERLHRLGIGRLAKRPKDWVRELEALMDPNERVRQAKENREALESLDIAHHVTDWEDAYEALL